MNDVPFKFALGQLVIGKVGLEQAALAVKLGTPASPKIMTVLCRGCWQSWHGESLEIEYILGVSGGSAIRLAEIELLDLNEINIDLLKRK